MIAAGLMPAFALLGATPETAPALATPRAAATAPFAPDADLGPDPTLRPDVTVNGRRYRTKGDPLEHVNRKVFKFNQSLDRKLLRPAAMGYKHVVPKFLRSALRNLFSELTEPMVFVNYLLQLKPGKAAETVARFVINATFGVAGTVDVAKRKDFKLPHRPNGFGDTLGFYGVKPGPFLMLPVLGPSTLRDAVGAQVDAAVLPVAVGFPFDRLEYQIPHAVIHGLDVRAEADADLAALNAGALDPYATLRSVYLQDRAGEIAELKGEAADAPAADGDDPLADPAAAPSPSAPDGAASPPAGLEDPLVDPAPPAAQPDPAGATPGDAPAADPAAPARR